MLKIYTKKAKIPKIKEFSKVLCSLLVLLLLSFNSSITYAQEEGEVEDFMCFSPEVALGTEKPFINGSVMRNGKWQTEGITEQGATITGYDPNELGQQIVQVTFHGITREAYIFVFRIPSGFNFDDINTTVNQYDMPTGLVTVSYDDADYEEVSISNMDIFNFDNSEVGTYNATVKWHNFEAPLTINVLADPNTPQKNSNDYYEISNADELMWLERYIRYNPYANAMLTNDIDFNDNLLDEDGDIDYYYADRQWTFGGTYYGTFDGNGFIINGFYSSSNGFCYNNYGTIKNVGFVDEYIETESDGICFGNYGTISKCFTIGGSKSSNGICAKNYSTVKNCYTLTPKAKLIAENDDKGVVTACYQNSDFTDYFISGVTSLSTKELCNGKLPTGFSLSNWKPGYIDGETYTFPQLKIFETPQSITFDYIETPDKDEYEVGEPIDLTGSSIYAYYYGLEISIDGEITADNVENFATDKAGSFTATITYGNIKQDYDYSVRQQRQISELDLEEFYIRQNFDLEDISFFVIYDNGDKEYEYLSNEDAEIHNLDISTIGEYNDVYVTYKGFESPHKTFTVYKGITDIDLTNVSPIVYQYQTFTGTATIIYDDGTIEDIDIQDIYNDTYNSIGEGKEQTFYYNGFSKSFIFDVVADPNQPTIDENGVYQIATVENLRWFVTYANKENPSANAILTDDIDLNPGYDVLGEDGNLNESVAENLVEWIPISNYFGTFDGNGHYIKGLYIANSEYNIAFCQNLYGIVKNLGLEDCYLQTSADYASGICIWTSYSSISGCYVQGYIECSTRPTGICYQLSYGSLIDNCYSLCKLVSVNDYSGYNIMYNNYGGTISNCYGNSDYSSNDIYGVTTLSTEQLCNGNLPSDEFDKDIWAVGSVSGNKYTFPQLKVFGSHALSTTISDKKTIVYPEAFYTIGDKFSCDGMQIGYLIPGTNSLIDAKDVTEESLTITDFSTEKAGIYTATIEYEGVSVEYNYFVSQYQKPAVYSDQEYSISTASELMWFAEYANKYNNYAKGYITNDITLNENLVERVKKGQTDDLVEWTPIGTKDNPFYGFLSSYSYSYTVSGIYVNQPDMDYVGMFGYTKNSDNFHITDSYIKGHNYVGGIYGYIEGNGNYYDRYYMYFTGCVVGNDYVGGIAGYEHNIEITTQSYVAAEIDTKSENAGAFFGNENESRKFSHCYYDKTLCTLAPAPNVADEDGEVEGRTTFHTGEIALLLNNANDSWNDYWCQDLSNKNSYPEYTSKYDFKVHYDIDGEGYHNPVYENDLCVKCMPVAYPAPELDEDNAYIIADKEDLLGFMQLLYKDNETHNAKLIADIEFNDNWFTNTNYYYGTFDGGFHTIKGLNINGYESTGLFCYLGSDGEVKNLILKDAKYSGKDVGGIVAENYGKITNCVFDGEINALNYAAGIACENDGSINGCINNGNITAQNNAGGIAAYTYNYSDDFYVIENCYNTGTIKSNSSNIGGIQGGHAGIAIKNCYNTGKIDSYWGNSITPAYYYTAENIYNNSDVCDKSMVDGDYTGSDLSSAELCNGELPSGFSSDIWVPGSVIDDKNDNIAYTFPHLKVFDGKYPAYTIEGTFDKTIVNVELTAPSTVEFVVTEDYDFSDGYLTVSYNFGEDEIIYLNNDDVTISYVDYDILDQSQQIKVEYEGFTKTFDVTVLSKAIEEISITAPNQTEYMVGRSLNLEGGKFTIKYNDGETIDFDLDDEDIYIYGFNSSIPTDDQTVYVYYYDYYSGDVETSFSVSIIERTVASIEVITPDNTEYYTTFSIDFSKYSMKVTYTDNYTETLALKGSGATISDYDNQTPGTKNITATYQGVSDDFEVTYLELSIAEVHIAKYPANTSYIIGEDFNYYGGKLTIVASNDEENIISMTDADVSFEGYDNTKVGSQEITVYYQGIPATEKITVTVINPDVDIITIFMKTNPKTEYSVKEQLDVEGGIFTVSYQDGTTADFRLDADEVILSAIDYTILNSPQTITVTYQGFSTSFEVTVIYPISDFTIIAPNKTEYFYGEDLDLSGAVINITYENGSEGDVNITSDMISGYDAYTIGDQKITVTYGNISGSFIVTVSDGRSIINTDFTQPSKISYIEGQEFDFTGAALRILYSDANGEWEDIELTADMFSGFNSEVPVASQIITLTYANKTFEYEISISAKTLTNIELTKAPTKTSYIETQDFDPDGAQFTAIYDNGTEENIALDDIVFSGYSNEVGTHTITATYNGQSVTFDIEVAKLAINNLIVKKAPAQLQYRKGEALNINDGVLSAVYNDGSKKDVSFADADFSGFNNTVLGTQSISIKYDGKSTSIIVYVISTQDIASIAISEQPSNITYREGEKLNITDGELTITYTDKSTEKLALFDNLISIIGYNADKLGEQTLTVKYFNKETTLKVTVIAKAAKSIAVTSKPATQYIETQSLDLNNGVITVVYNNGTKETVALDNENVKVSGFDGNTIGTQTLTVEYLGLTTTFDVTVNAKSASSIAIVKQPAKTVYFKGEEFDATDGEIEVTFDNGTKETVALNKATISGYKATRVGVQTIAAHYLGRKATLDVTVKEKSAVSAKITQMPKTEYVEGTGLSLANGILEITYDNGSVKNVDLELADVSGYDASKIGSQVITVDYFGTKAEFTVTVKAKEVSNIAITSLPKTSYKLGEELNLAGGVITVSYNNGSSERVDLSKATVTGFNSTQAGKQTLQVSYLDKTASFDVTVSDKTPVSEINGEDDAVKVWSFARTIYIETAADTKYTIVDLNGRMITTSTTKSTHEEIQVNGSGIYVVIINGKSYKVSASR